MATILVVDDLAANRQVLTNLLTYCGHRLFEAANGSDALAVARAEQPDLVITDVLMPVMDGYELVRQLRADAATNHTPVLFYTAHYAEREARALAASSGVAYVLTKPVDPETVIAVVTEALAGGSNAQLAAHAPLSQDFDRAHLRLLTDKLSRTDEDLRSANARLRALVNIGLELASESDTQSLLRTVSAAARDLFGASYVTLGIVSRLDRSVQRLVTNGADLGGWTLIGGLPPGVLGTVTLDRQPLRGDNPGGDPVSLGLPAFHPPVHALLVAPIASPAHVYGWICLVGNEGQLFSDDDEQLVMALAGQVGRIYENGYFYSVARQERDRAQRYLDTAEVILLALDLEGRITQVNRKGAALLERSESELIGREWITTCLPERVHEQARTSFAAVYAGDLSVIEMPIVPRSGRERLIEWRNMLLRDETGDVTGTLSSGTDITDRRTLEQQYYQAQKMEAVGRLAGGVAHDFNNLLTAILGYCELLLADRRPDDPEQQDISEIQKAGVRAASLTSQLLAFSRKQIIEPSVIDLNAVVADMRPMLERLIGEDVRVVLALAADLSPVLADRGQIEQIVMNLAVNARDAMPGGGALTIDTANVELDEHYAKTHLDVRPGAYVMLAMTDTGSGMTPDVMARLFEPFFTTKEPGRGTGLGLATVHGIVLRSGGSVGVYSEPGKGTSFKVYLPQAAPGEAVETPRPSPREQGGNETILVVEDAEGLRHLAQRLLERQGYRVLVAADAEEALEEFERHPSIDVLLTDVVMPGGSGPDLAARLRQQRDSLKVIYMSGYTEDAITRHGVLISGVAFVEKPFTAAALGAKIREVLDG
jgi:PAS domain S-box-containing protein